ncbi:MAG: hypothetical protein CVT49_07470 [candidate division Zixibacteria bacterium HGW-Zixibacteria-1]|nr:MAG: hypothetical protein CVT49_07470 [candidate division Zixibacteria bacterium HGW-Zixibacteria-1]
MINFVEMILMGVLATLIMDILAIIFVKLKVIHAMIGPQVVGRCLKFPRFSGHGERILLL